MTISGPAFDDMSRSELLDTATALAETERQAQIDQLRLAAHWAAANGPDTIDPDLASLPGRPRMRFYGGHGTPTAASFAGADLGARLGRSTTYGDNLISDALDLQFRLTDLWDRVRHGEVLPSYARHAAKKTRDLEPEEAAYVDARVAESADGRITWTQFETLVDASIIAAAPAAAKAREEAARMARFARATRPAATGTRGFYVRSDIASITKLDAIVAHLARILADLGSWESLDLRRARAATMLAAPDEVVKLLAAHAAWKQRGDSADADAPAVPAVPAASETDDPPISASDLDADDPLLDFADLERPTESDSPGDAADVVAAAVDLWARHGDGQPLGAKPVINWSRILPSVTLYVHLYGGRIHADELTGTAMVGADRGEAPSIVRVEGIGPATESWLRDHLRLNPALKLNLKPVIDLEHQAPVDDWEIPDRHREAVRLMTPADRFPWATATVNQPGGWSGMQIDHTQPWRPGKGDQSRIGNYGPLTQRHHNLKSHGGWQVQQPFPGVYIWRDPHGAFYLVDHTGTRALGDTA